MQWVFEVIDCYAGENFRDINELIDQLHVVFCAVENRDHFVAEIEQNLQTFPATHPPLF